MTEKLKKLRYFIYRLAEDASSNGTLADRRRVAEEAYTLIDAELPQPEPESPRELTKAEKIEVTARPHQSPAEIKTAQMLAEIADPKEIVAVDQGADVPAPLRRTGKPAK